MVEVPRAREDHRQAQFVGAGDYVGVLLAAAGLDDGRGAGLARPSPGCRGTGRTRRWPARSRRCRPRRPPPYCLASCPARRAEFTRLIWPAPAPSSVRSLASTMALLLTCLHTSQANRRSSICCGCRLALRDDLPVVLVQAQQVAVLHQQPADDVLEVLLAVALAGQRAGLQQADLLAPALAAADDLQRPGSKDGAMMISAKNPPAPAALPQRL